jgi:rhamnosyl/mannosyltransferase
MKILQIGKYYPPYHFGGIETLTKILHDGLWEHGIENCFLGFLPVSFKEDIAVDNHIYLCKTDIDIFSTQFSLNFIKKWREIKDDYDIVFISMPHPFANLVAAMFPPKQAKIVLWWHSDIVKQKILLMFYKPLLVSLIKKSAAVVAPTNIHIDKSDFAEYLMPKKHLIPFPHHI